ncbi:MAG: hypothetical protein WCK90_06260, partial [archaeon]
ATLFMQKKGKDISGFTPYLSVYASDNEKYFPSSFLYLLSGGDDQYTRIIQLQKQNKFWELTASPYNKFYDTSVALMALSSGAAAEGENAKNYLLSIQGKNGCWDKFRDTAFILYSAAYKRGAGTPGASALCEEVSGQSCARETACLDAGGSVRSLFECGSPFDICCSIEVPTLTCSESGGSVCSSSLECSGRIVSASDGSCCMEDCVTPTATEAVCNDICAVSCGTGETEVYGTCDGIGEVCCAPQTSSGGGFWTWFWIILLILLIALVILAIVFKDKIKLWNYKRTGKVSSNPVNRSTPGGPTRPSGPMLMQRPMARPALAQRPTQTTRTVIRPSMPARPVRKPGSTDMDETLRKLKEMTK